MHADDIRLWLIEDNRKLNLFQCRDAFLIGILNSLTSVFAGVVVFAILGNLADGGDVTNVLQVHDIINVIFWYIYVHLITCSFPI